MNLLRTHALRAASIVLATGVVACAPSSSGPRAPSAAPTGSTHVPSPSPGRPTSAPRDGRAGAFPVPFTYTLPAGVTIKTSIDHVGGSFYQFRHPISGDAYDSGIIVRAVSGGRIDPCSETSGPRPLADADAFMEYFATIPTVSVSDTVKTVVGGHPGKTATLAFGPPTAACSDVWLWADLGSITQNGGRGVVRVTMVDVEGVHVAILTSGPADWYVTADSFIASIQFVGVPPASPS